MTARSSRAPPRGNDPLLLLRQSTIAGTPVIFDEVDDSLEFDNGVRIARTEACGFRLSRRKCLVDIGSVWYMLKEISDDRSYTEAGARRQGCQYISVAVRHDLCDFLTGKSETCEGLQEWVIDKVRRRDDDDDDAAAEEPALKAAKADGPSASGRVASVSSGQPWRYGAGSGPVSISYTDVVERQRPVKDLDVLVRCPGRCVPNADLILKIAQEEIKNWHCSDHVTPRTFDAGKVPFHVELSEMLRKDRACAPIILVPCNKTAPINLQNAKELFQDGTYKSTDGKASPEAQVLQEIKFFESTRPESIEVSRHIGGRLWTFEVRDSVKGFTKDQWKRTVAVVADGTDWQFKGWPFATQVDLFASIRGIFFQQHGVPLPVHVIQWSVDIVTLPAHNHDHRSLQVRDIFFSYIEDFLNSKRPMKFVNHKIIESEKRLLFLREKPVL